MTNENDILKMKEDIDCIVECMNKLVQMTTTSVHLSRDSNNKIEILKKSLSDCQSSLDDSNLYIKHLEHRIMQLENKQEADTTSHNSNENTEQVMDAGLEETQEQGISANSDLLLPPSNSPNIEVFQFGPFPTVEQTHEGGNSQTLDNNNPDSISNTISRISCLEEEIKKIKYQEETESCQRSVLFSNFPTGFIESLRKRKESFWPLLRSKLRPYELDNILIDATKVKIVGNGLKIEYIDHYRANSRIQGMRRHVGFLRKQIPNWGLENIKIQAAINLKFTKLTPSKLNKRRRTLEKLGKYMKKQKKINFFDLVVVRDDIYLRTCWTHFQINERSQTSSRKRVFTYYDDNIAKRILAGEVSIDEREARLERNRYTFPTVGLVYHAYSEDIDVYGDVPGVDTGGETEP